MGEAERDEGPPANALADAPGAKPTEGEGVALLVQLVGVWWGPKEEMYRVESSWTCERTSSLSDKVHLLDLAWDGAGRRILLGGAWALRAVDIVAEDGLVATRAPWSKQSSSTDSAEPA